MKIITGILILFSLTGLVCFGQETKDFSYETPYKRDSTNMLFFTPTQQKIEQLHLENFEKGVDSFGIRIWFDYCSEVTRFDELIEIKYTNSEWTGTYYPMIIADDNSIGTITIEKSAEVSITPKFNWEIILCSIHSFDVLTLPLDYDIVIKKKDEETGKTALTMVFDGSMILIEIATPTMYRFYEYYSPGYFSEIYPEVKKMNDFLNFIKSQFSIFDDDFKTREKMIKNKAKDK